MTDISDRKKHHIDLAASSQISYLQADRRFYYEPLLGKHPDGEEFPVDFFGKQMRFPLWVSSMTGGTEMAAAINERLAMACKEFGLGMGLGSCRILLEESDKYLKDFNVRPFLGDQPLFANLGIAQIEKSLAKNEWTAIEDLVAALDADGLIIHVNPLQEWIQPEGDRFAHPPIETIQTVLEKTSLPLIVKEVGQGMGPESLKALMQLPVVIEFGALGGTNFSQLEVSRRDEKPTSGMNQLAYVGHDVNDMIRFIRDIRSSEKKLKMKGFIISGGIKNYLDGFHGVKSVGGTAVYGQASELLKYARISYDALQKYLTTQVQGYRLAEQYLTIREA